MIPTDSQLVDRWLRGKTYEPEYFWWWFDHSEETTTIRALGVRRGIDIYKKSNEDIVRAVWL